MGAGALGQQHAPLAVVALFGLRAACHIIFQESSSANRSGRLADGALPGLTSEVMPRDMGKCVLASRAGGVVWGRGEGTGRRAAQAAAALEGRTTVSPEDVSKAIRLVIIPRADLNAMNQEARPKLLLPHPAGRAFWNASLTTPSTQKVVDTATDDRGNSPNQALCQTCSGIVVGAWGLLAV